MGVNVVRNVQATGEDTWTDARRATASFLSEAGTLTGIRDIERGITTEVQPFVTARLTGARRLGGEFERDDLNPDAGVNLKVALPAMTLDATVKPDFSQVESDAGLVTVNERFALFFAEKRPFSSRGSSCSTRRTSSCTRARSPRRSRAQGHRQTRPHQRCVPLSAG